MTGFLRKLRGQISGRKSMVFGGGIVTGIFLILFLYTPTLFSFFEQKVYDVMHATVKSKGEPLPVVVDIDEKSLERIGQWPWPRYRVAQLLQTITDNEPAAVGVDILFPEPDRTSLNRVVENLRQRSGISITLQDIPEMFHDNDQLMAHVIQPGKIILACKLLLSSPSTSTSTATFISNSTSASPSTSTPSLRPPSSSSPSATPPQISSPSSSGVWQSEPLPLPLDVLIRSGPASTDSGNILDSFYGWPHLLMPLPELAAGVDFRCGFVNAISDSDGTIRQAPLLQKYQSHLFPSLALSAVMMKMSADKVILHTGVFGLQALQIRKQIIPISSDGRMLIHFRNRELDVSPPLFTPFETISAADLFVHPVEARLKDQIVFVGTSAAGLGDRHVTPLNRVYPGVYIHAVVADNILNGNFISRPAWAKGAELVLMGAVGGLATFILIYMKPLICLLLAGAMAASLWGFQMIVLQKAHFHLSMLYPFLVLFCTVSLLSLIRFRIGEKVVLQRTREAEAAQNMTLISISGLASRRDRETARHVRRTARYLQLLAVRLSRHPDYRAELDDETIEMMVKSAPLHDIGKVAVSDAVLLKSGKMTEEEFNEVKRHTEHGWETIRMAEKASDIDVGTSFLKIAKDLVRYHHEKWDGSGYNHGLKGKEIPLAARLMALADVYDGLITSKVNVSAREMQGQRNDRIIHTHEQAKKIIVESRGTHFDPDVVEAFLADETQFKTIAIEMADEMTE